MPPISFQSIKSSTLRVFTDRDKDNSPKATIDYPCREILHILNSHPSYYSLSSCSGRVAAFESAAFDDDRSGVDDIKITDPSVPMDATFGKGVGR